jgi:peroxiredoxin
MSIQIGERIPDVKLMTMTPEGARSLQTSEVFAGKRVVLFGLPAAFSPTCSDAHLPGYLLRAQEIKEAGVDTIACVAVNDVFAMGAWGKASNVGDDILMLADGNGELTRALDLELDGRAFGLGMRSRRYAALVDDGVVLKLEVEDGPGVTVGAAEEMLSSLRSKVG